MRPPGRKTRLLLPQAKARPLERDLAVDLAGMSRTLTLLVLCMAAVTTSRRAAAPSPPRGPPISIGDSLEIRTNDPDYLGKDWQVVSVLTPLSSNRRVLDHKTGNFTGMQQRRGMVTWVKKREGWPFERLKRQPFKLRYLREDPRGVMLSMMEEGKLNVRIQDSNPRPLPRTPASLATPLQTAKRRPFKSHARSGHVFRVPAVRRAKSDGGRADGAVLLHG